METKTEINKILLEIIKKAEKISNAAQRIMENTKDTISIAQQLQGIHSGEIDNHFFIRTLNTVIDSKDLSPTIKDAIIKHAVSKIKDRMYLQIEQYPTYINSIKKYQYEIAILNTEYRACAKKE